MPFRDDNDPQTGRQPNLDRGGNVPEETPTPRPENPKRYLKVPFYSGRGRATRKEGESTYDTERQEWVNSSK